MITAIQTAYKGYHFRSRLEARWAVFFDALGLQWEYEPEGFEMPDGRRYLPDFFIKGNAHYGPYLEIKGGEPQHDEFSKMLELCYGLTCYGIIVYGTPGEEFTRSFDKNMGCDDLLPLAQLLQIPEAAYHMAVRAARSARFEHGQKGATL